jgi:uncharacterized phage infection (PIP) family protein YhgE
MSSFIDIVNKDYELMSGGGGEAGVDKDSGQTYYYNTETEESRWDMTPEIINTELQKILKNTEKLKLNEKKCQKSLKEKEQAVKQINLQLQTKMNEITETEIKLKKEMKNLTTENTTKNDNLRKELEKLKNEKDTLIKEHKTFLANITPTIQAIIKTLKE